MTRRPLTALLLVLVASLTCGCGNGNADYLTISPEKIDFGKVLQGTAHERTLVLRNGGTKPVAIQSTHFNCSCFQAHPFQRMLQPGEERTLRVTFVSSAIGPGPIRGKKLTVSSNDGWQPRIEVPLEGEVVESCVLTPPQIELGTLEVGQESRVEVRPGPGMRLTLESWRITHEDVFEARMAPSEEAGGHDLTIRVRDGAAGQGRLQAAIEVKVEVEGQGFAPLKLDYVVRVHGVWPN